jgi:phospholipid/cholesterol/gamma-HCH transport system substrate-binding protein
MRSAGSEALFEFQSNKGGMTRQAQVGAFAIVALLLLFGVFYVITDFGTRHTGYRVGVHFQSAAGVTSGALVYFSGVNVGSVDSIQLLSDNTVDVILAINRDIDIPAASRFLIQAPLTGSPSVIILPPRAKPPLPLLPRQVLPVADQPQGSNGTSVADLLEQGQGELKRFDTMMSLIEQRTPKLLNTLQTTLNNANELTVSTRATVDRLSGELLAMGANLQGSLGTASANVVELSTTLNTAATTDSKKLGALLDQFQSTAVALNRSMNALQDLATDPRLKQNILTTTQSIADTTQTLAAMTKDLRSVTGDPQTQAQMRNTIANLDAVMQKANALLGELGGTSHVYGVDAGATPAPLTVPSTSPYPGSSPAPGSTPSNGISPNLRARLQGKLANLAHDLVAVQVRLSGLSPAHNLGLNPVLTESQGPLGDINLVFLPHATTSVTVGANAIGTNTTWNALLGENKGDFHIAAGVLYSQIGVQGQYAPLHGLGFETRVYDLTYPMIDVYGNLHVAPGAELFFGQRDITHASRRNTFGLQYQF